MKQRSFILIFFILLTSNVIAQTITTNGFTFNPDTLYVNEGDTINFNLSNSHNAVEVDEATFLSNGNTSNSGFNIPFGGGSWIADSIQTYYYVCQPNASMGMKGVIISSCNKTIIQNLKGFSPNPLYQSSVWSYDTLTITNSSNCDIRIRPEFDIAHYNLPIGSTDLNLKRYDTLSNSWINISYFIDANGHAVGYLDPTGSTNGMIINAGDFQQIIIKIQLEASANYGTYCAIWQIHELDILGNFIQNLTIGAPICLDFVDCSIFEIDSTYSSNITCFNNNNGSASILSIQNGKTLPWQLF